MLIIALCTVQLNSALATSVCELGDAPCVSDAAPPFAERPVKLAGDPPVFFTVNAANREEVRSFYNTVFLASEEAEPVWTGTVPTCSPGTTADVFRYMVALRVNWMRAMAGVPAWITFDETFNQKDQQTALMISANNDVSHTPPSSWKCYTADGAEAAGKSNLAIGIHGPESILRYIEDFGTGNYAVGHRRWILMPQTRFMGTGDVPENSAGPAANALWILDGNMGQPRPTTRESYVGWPPPGYVPYQVVFARWSFSYPKADFSSADVTMASNRVPVAVTLEPVRTGFGENTVVWCQVGLDTSQPLSWPKPPADVRYAISVKGVLINGVSRNFDYTVTVFDPQTTGSDTVLPDVSGPDWPVAGRPNAYHFTPVPVATSHQWQASRRAIWTLVERAEVDSGDFTAKTSPGYDYRVAGAGVGGSAAWHLAHTVPEDQWLQYRRIILPGPTTSLQFKSKLTWASTTQKARVQVSTDDGNSWVDVYSQAGTSNSGQMFFEDRSVSLGAFADRPLLVRFLYHHEGGSYFPQAEVGWFIDDLTVAQGEELVPAVSEEVASGAGFDFSPSEAGKWALVVRGKVYGAYWLEWGHAKRVTAAAEGPVLTFTGPPVLTGNQVQLLFSVTNKAPGMTLRLDWSDSLPGHWSRDSAAVLQELVPATKYRFDTTMSGSQSRYYRVVGE